MQKYIKLVLVALAISGVLQAHAKREASTPADGQVINALPEVITLRFKAPVQLTQATFTLPSGRISEARLPAKSEASTQSELRPPIAGPGAYTLHYTTQGLDGHTEQHQISFLLKQ